MKALKNIINAIFAFIIVITMISCEKNEMKPHILSGGYKLHPCLFEEYIDPDDFLVSMTDLPPNDAYIRPQIIFTGKSYTRITDPDKFAKFQNKTGDIWENGVLLPDIGHYDYGMSCIPFGLKKISVTAVDKYNDSHPAGSSLDDIFKFRFDDYCLVLESANKNEINPLMYMSGDIVFYSGENVDNKFLENFILIKCDERAKHGEYYPKEVKLKFVIEFEHKTISRIVSIPDSTLSFLI